MTIFAAGGRTILPLSEMIRSTLASPDTGRAAAARTFRGGPVARLCRGNGL